MLGKERLAHIIKRLQIQPSISIQALSKEMNVSFSTVQRDLAKLQKEGKIDRTRGGAISNKVALTLSGMNEIAVSEKVNLNTLEKDIIAQCAYKYIKEGECIFLDSGTTIAHIVPYIINMNISIVTNSLYLQRKLIGCLGKVYLIGGEYNQKFDMSVGASTVMELEKMHFDRAFLSVSGVNVNDDELLSVESSIAAIKQMVIKRSKETYVLADHTKFNVLAVHTFAKISDIKYLFTDSALNQKSTLKNIVICKKN